MVIRSVAVRHLADRESLLCQADWRPHGALAVDRRADGGALPCKHCCGAVCRVGAHIGSSRAASLGNWGSMASPGGTGVLASSGLSCGARRNGQQAETVRGRL